jgi:Amt family ammonium transporter
MENMQTQIDTGWVLMCATMVFLMQAGFCCLETGLVRAKNSINVAIKNLVDFGISAVAFGLVGAMVAFGESWGGILGVTMPSLDDPRQMTLFLFQLMFCGTATTIVSGAVAERMRFSGYLVVATLVAVVIYPVSAHWVWGGALSGTTSGWLAERGFVDFAGSTVVHVIGGVVALVACLIIGPRRGRFDSEHGIEAHNIPTAAIGVLILWFGWYGFNGGSTLSLNAAVPQIMVNTTMSAVGGLLGALILSWIVTGRPQVGDVMNGALAGLVAVTASCHAVDIPGAVCIGLIGGLLSTLATRWLVSLRIDDAVGAFPVHAVAGIWGTLAVAIFGDPSRLGTGLGPASQLMVQLLGVAACCAWAAGCGWLLIRLAGLLVPLRVSEADEDDGLNIAEHGARTEIHDLLGKMDLQWRTGDYSQAVTVASESEVGQAAAQYNRVLQAVNSQRKELVDSHQELETQNGELQQTRQELSAQLEELEQFNRSTVEREMRMVELKRGSRRHSRTARRRVKIRSGGRRRESRRLATRRLATRRSVRTTGIFSTSDVSVP